MDTNADVQFYTIDLTTLLHILSRQRQTGRLNADIARVPGSKLPGRAYLEMSAGKITVCMLITDNRPIEDSKALEILADLGAIDWRWTRDRLSGTSQEPLRAVSPDPLFTHIQLVCIPTHAKRIDPVEMHALSHLQKRVLGLVNGTHTVDNIAALLARSNSQEILTTLYELEMWGLITWL